MWILAADTCFPTPSVALMHQGRLVETAFCESKQHTVEQLVPHMAAILEKHHLSTADIALMAATIGPGGFSGVRLAMTAIKGYALPHGTPTSGFTSLEVLAFAVKQSSQHHAATIALNAARGQCYVQSFDLQPATPEATDTIALVDYAAIPSHTQNPIFTDAEASIGHNAQIFPLPESSAATLAALCHQRHMSGQQAQKLGVPLHIRPADAKAAKAPLIYGAA